MGSNVGQPATDDDTPSGARPALFEVSGDAHLATEWCRSPWDRHSSHGGPMAILSARLSETIPSLAPMTPVRMSMDLMGRVPLHAPLLASTRILREGRRVQLVQVELTDESGTTMVTSRILRIRTADVELPPDVADFEGDRRGPELPSSPTPTPPRSRKLIAFNNDGIEFASAHRTFGEGAGPNHMWCRLAVPVVAGETPTAFERAAAASDFGNGMSSALPFEGWLFINNDVTLVLHRLPVGEWVHLQSSTFVEPSGSGASDCVLSDRLGRIGRTHQILLVDQQQQRG